MKAPKQQPSHDQTNAQKIIALCERATPERIYTSYSEVLGNVLPSLYNNAVYYSNGIDIADSNPPKTIAFNSLVLPLVDSNLIPQSVAIIPPAKNEIEQPPYYEPTCKGAFLLGEWTGANPVYVVIDLHGGLRLALAKPDSIVLVCFNTTNLAGVVRDWQFKAKSGLFVPVACHELEGYKTLLTATQAVILSLEYDIYFDETNEEIDSLLSNAKIHRMNDVSSLASLTNEEKQALTWQEINDKEPFILLIDEQGEPNPYPIDALPPVARQAVQAIAYYAQAPLAMAGQCVIGALSYLAQPHVNAYDKNSQHGQPCSLFVLTEGASGDRKSTCQRLADQRIYERQKKKMHQYSENLKDHKVTLASCKTAKDRLEILENHPEPTNPQTLFKDATLEPIISAFIRADIVHGAWVSDEAGQIFGGHTLQGDNKTSALSALTKLWDNGTAERTRSRSNQNESGIAYDVRLTINTLGQKAILETVLNDDVYREQGFLPRFLFSAPASLAGTRLYKDLTAWKANPYNDARLVKYWERCNDLLDIPSFKPIDHDHQRPVIPLSPDAETLLINFYNMVESEMSKGGRFVHLKAFASRAWGNAVRVATVLAFFEGKEAVTAELMQSGIKMAEYSLSEWERYSGYVERDKMIVEADRLENWLIHYCRENNQISVPRADVLQRVTPTNLRKAKALDNVLKILIDNNHIKEVKANNKAYIELNPLLFEYK